MYIFLFFFKQKTAYEMRISDWSSDVCSSDLITGRSFIVDPRVDGKVTVVSARPMSPEQVWDTFESVLRVSGFAVVPAGGMYKVVPEGMAAADGGVGMSGDSPDSVVTRVIAVRQVPAA